MPLLDLNLAVVMDQQGQPSVRLTIETKWLSFSNAQHARALKNLAPCLESDQTEDGEPVFLYNEVTGVALTVTGVSDSAKNEQFNETYFAHSETERVWGLLLGLLGDKTFTNLGALCEELRAAYEKLPHAERSEMAFQGDKLIKRIPPGQWPPAMRHRTPSQDWEDLVTFARLMQRSHRLVGLLQRFIYPTHQACFCSSKLFTEVCRYLVSTGTLSEELVDTAEEELDDDAEQHEEDARNDACARVARAVINAIAAAADLDSSIMPSPTEEAQAHMLLIDLIIGSKYTYDGNSEFMMKNLRNNIAAVAPLLYTLVGDATDDVALRDHVTDIAAAFPRDAVEGDTKTLLTRPGLKNLERHLRPYEAYIKAPTTMAAHVRERVANAAERVQKHERQAKAEHRCARRHNTAAHTHPPPAHCPRITRRPHRHAHARTATGWRGGHMRAGSAALIAVHTRRAHLTPPTCPRATRRPHRHAHARAATGQRGGHSGAGAAASIAAYTRRRAQPAHTPS